MAAKRCGILHRGREGTRKATNVAEKAMIKNLRIAVACTSLAATACTTSIHDRQSRIAGTNLEPPPSSALSSGAIAGDSVTTTAGSMASRPLVSCSDGVITVDNHFEGSGMLGCEVVDRGHFRILSRREDANVTNCSAWYAFRVVSNEPKEAIIDVDYDRCGHRYAPKMLELASEGAAPAWFEQKWTVLSPRSLNVTEKEEVPQARLVVPVSSSSVIVAGQELLLARDYRNWLDSLDGSASVKRNILGYSLERRSIEQIVIGDNVQTAHGQLVIIGRQHPPETTGALALFAFTERLLESDQLANEFRNRFTTTVIPLLNPDGVSRGYWRHSEGERDLNRDWGPFTQPETRLVRDLLQKIEMSPARDLRFFMDFHSTHGDVLYTLDKALTTDPAGFMDNWLADYEARLPGYTVKEQPGHNPDSAVSKAWVYEAFSVPTVTYEIGDETDRVLIRRLGRAAAEATMTQLLAIDAAKE